MSMLFVRGKDYSLMHLPAPVSLHSLKEMASTAQVRNQFLSIVYMIQLC